MNVTMDAACGHFRALVNGGYGKAIPRRSPESRVRKDLQVGGLAAV
jgi:hypothetical protein